MNMTQVGALSAKEEFFYPDTKMGALPDTLRLVMPKDGQPTFQLLLQTNQDKVPVTLKSEDFEADFFSMHKIPVEYNTGNGEDQGGAMVLMDRPKEKPAYATRLAPFFVYDCLEPIENEICAQEGVAALYVRLCLNNKNITGAQTLLLTVGDYVLHLNVMVYDVTVEKDAFPLTNWFSLESMCRLHGLEKNTEACYDMVRKYARAMRDMHQTMFNIFLDDSCVVSKAPYTFDFSHVEPVIRCFFEEGLQTMEIGSLLCRGFKEDGSPDMYSDNLKCAMAQDVAIDTKEGYAITVRFVQSLAAFLTKNGWQDKAIFHIMDEPDIHFKGEQALLHRKRQFYLATSILRKYLPSAKVIEAVSSAEFRGGVDIWVPGTPGYEAHKEEFDALIDLGEDVFAYVCCGPEGNWLNRFLDFAVLKGRLLYWGCAKNRLSGFLHWGLNQFPKNMNPFEGTSCPNDTGIGTSFPCGDAFILYPGTEGPWQSLRSEAVRKGVEDVTMLRTLYALDKDAHQALVEKVFRTNSDYNDDPAVFLSVYEELLQMLEKKQQKN